MHSQQVMELLLAAGVAHQRIDRYELFMLRLLLSSLGGKRVESGALRLSLEYRVRFAHLDVELAILAFQRTRGPLDVCLALGLRWGHHSVRITVKNDFS